MEEKSLELVDHLAELRTRLVRAVICLFIGVIAAWYFYPQLAAFLTHPMEGVMAKIGSKFLFVSFPEAFLVRMQICLVSGLIITSPLIVRELWGFISPGLTPSEKRPLRWIAPLAAVLFFSGVALCYAILPAAFSWFAYYVPRNAELRPTMQVSILFTVKMLFVFGLVFELPVVLMLLGKVGIVSSRMLRQQWRTALVITSIVAAVATPSNDAFTMLMMAVPLAVLYFFSVFLVQLVELDKSPLDMLKRLFPRRRRRTGRL